MFNLTINLVEPQVEVGDTIEVAGNLTFMGMGVPGVVKVTSNGHQVLAFARPPGGEYRASIAITEARMNVQAEHITLPPFKAESPRLEVEAVPGARAPAEVSRVEPIYIPGERITVYREAVREVPVQIPTPVYVPTPAYVPTPTPVPTPIPAPPEKPDATFDVSLRVV